jgi:hypothetical protein
MAARIVLPARCGKVCEVLRLTVALRDVFDLRVAIKKEASCCSRALVTSRLVANALFANLATHHYIRLLVTEAPWNWLPGFLAPRTGFEPVTYRLTAGRSTVELSRNSALIERLQYTLRP